MPRCGLNTWLVWFKAVECFRRLMKPDWLNLYFLWVGHSGAHKKAEYFGSVAVVNPKFFEK